jgi:hypothetical protein
MFCDQKPSSHPDLDQTLPNCGKVCDHHPDISEWRSTSACMLVLRFRKIAASFLARGGIDAPTSFDVRSLH